MLRPAGTDAAAGQQGAEVDEESAYVEMEIAQEENAHEEEELMKRAHADPTWVTLLLLALAHAHAMQPAAGGNQVLLVDYPCPLYPCPLTDCRLSAAENAALAEGVWKKLKERTKKAYVSYDNRYKVCMHGHPVAPPCTARPTIAQPGTPTEQWGPHSVLVLACAHVTGGRAPSSTPPRSVEV